VQLDVGFSKIVPIVRSDVAVPVTPGQELLLQAQSPGNDLAKT
jgi:hypothetical protein